MTEPARPKAERVPELLFSLLMRGGESAEPYTYSEEGLKAARTLLASFPPEVLPAVLKDVFRTAYVLDTKLHAPTAARALLIVGLELGGVEVFGSAAVPEARVSEETWRKVLGGERELPPAKKKPKTGKYPWELIGDPKDDEEG